MSLDKDVKGLGMPWEDAYGCAQAVKVGDAICISGQLGHDAQGNMVGPASPLQHGDPDAATTRTRMRCSAATAQRSTTWSRKCST